jgi:DNA-binding transcriptional ArsR family regulator
MVEYNMQLDLVFSSLSDPTRRDIIRRVSLAEQTVNQIAEQYKMSLAAVSKHIKILEKAKLITKRQNGREHIISAEPKALKTAYDYIKQYEKLWNDRFDRLEQVLKEEQ